MKMKKYICLLICMGIIVSVTPGWSSAKFVRGPKSCSSKSGLAAAIVRQP